MHQSDADSHDEKEMQVEEQIEFALTIEDVMAIDRFADLQNRPLQRRQWIAWSIAQAAFIVFYLVFYKSEGSSVYFGFVVGLNFCFALTIIAFFRLVSKQRKQNYQSLPGAAPHLFAPRLFRIEPRGVFQQGSSGDRLTYWSEIASVTETEKAVHVLTRQLGENGSQELYTVPRHAFNSGDEIRAFADLARGYLNEAQQNVAT